MDAPSIIRLATSQLYQLSGRAFDIFNLSKPASMEEAVDMAKLYKIVSKVSPLVGNLIEHDTVSYLNGFAEYNELGKWKRQDPGFPDIILEGSVSPSPGFEIKAWYPFSTEITGRFKDSQNHFQDDQTYLLLIAWLPEFIIYGRPLILDVLITSGKSVACTRDSHYHNPPHYLVIEPEDTTSRTKNLQQTCTNGYVWQSSKDDFKKAQCIVESWGNDGKIYRSTREYQTQIRTLLDSFNYRLDTNYAKIDRIVHADIEAFKTKVLNKEVYGLSVKKWLNIFASGDDYKISKNLSKIGLSDSVFEPSNP